MTKSETDQKLFGASAKNEPVTFNPPNRKKKKTVSEQLFEDDRIDDGMSAKDRRDMVLLQEIYSKKDIEMKSELNDSLIQAVTKGLLYADHFRVPIVSDLCNKLLELRVSKNRGGRKEFVDMARSMNANDFDSGKYDLSKRLFGVEK